MNQVQWRLRRETGLRTLKVGHTGTLDLLAQGVMVLGVGPATRLTPWILHLGKRYRGTFRLGVHSVSGDLEEKVVIQNDPPVPTLDQLQSVAGGFIGRIRQIPPGHSAIWVDGERAHKRMRRGEQFDMPSREVEIHELELIDYQYPDFTIDVRCGSGTYMRTLGNDIAVACGSCAVMTDLMRTQVGPFDVQDAIPPTEFSNAAESTTTAPLLGFLSAPTVALAHLPSIVLDEHDERRIRRGQPLTHLFPDAAAESEETATPNVPTPQEIVAVNACGELIAILHAKNDAWWPLRVFGNS